MLSTHLHWVLPALWASWGQRLPSKHFGLESAGQGMAACLPSFLSPPQEEEEEGGQAGNQTSGPLQEGQGPPGWAIARGCSWGHRSFVEPRKGPEAVPSVSRMHVLQPAHRSWR